MLKNHFGINSNLGPIFHLTLIALHSLAENAHGACF